MITGGRRILALLALGAVGILAALSISTSLALFSATGAQQTNSFASGTVTLTNSSGSTCQLTQTKPTCTYKIDYTGSLPAWIGLDVNGANLSGVVITDGTKTFTAGPDQLVATVPVSSPFSTTITVACPSTLASSNPCTTDSKDCGTGSDNQDRTGDAESQQEKDGDRDDKAHCGAVTVELQAHAVQAANNTNGMNTGPVSWS